MNVGKDIAVPKDEGTPLCRQDRERGQLEDARYANFFRLAHNTFEVLLEFGQQDARIHTRIYISPQHASILLDLLMESLRNHETTYGPMQLPEKPAP